MASSYQDDYMKTALRLPRDLHAELMEAARERGRSFNSEVVARLHDSIANADLARGDDGLNDLISRTVKHTMESMLKSGWFPRSGVIADSEADNLTSALVAAAEKAKAEAPALLSGSKAKNTAGALSPQPAKKPKGQS